MTKEQGINRVFDGPSHVVLLGAGASIASTIHTPEPSGMKLPSMDNFIDVVGLTDIIEPLGYNSGNRNFESIYSSLHAKSPHSKIVVEIENRVRNYFSGLTLPSTPTLYDYLIMALRPKDLIATFNWDPFLYQAFSRNRRIAGVPHVAFLHGSVSIGYSLEDKRAGPTGWFSKETGYEYVPTKLLYPVTEKNYIDDEFIAIEWERLKRWLESAKRITIFGYGAPDTDVEAIDLMSKAWGDKNQRNLEQVEIIDVQPEDVILKRWSRFIHTHHYDYCTDYFRSVLARFPRRTGESFMHQFFPSTPAEAFQESNPVPVSFDTLEEMWAWHQPLIEAERKHELR